GLRLGARGTVTLGRRFGSAVGALLSLWREHTSEAATWVRAEHERKLQLLAEAGQISLIRLRALAALQRPPATKSLVKLIASVMLDRIAASVLVTATLVWAIASRWTPWLALQ